nr:MAG TPA: hypothetical protein [Caudoviricetes sp.]
MSTPQEALEYLISLADEYLSHELVQSSQEDYERVQEAALLLKEKLNEPSDETLRESIQQLMKLIEDGVGLYSQHYETLNVRLRLSTEAKEKSRLAIALSETAGAVSALGAVIAHVLSDQGGVPTKLTDIFTGEGLSYPKVLNSGKKLYLPPKSPS